MNYPISASESGNNAYYIDYCEVVQHRPPYAACLCKLKNDNSACVAAVGMKTCAAKSLRNKEEDAGHAIFFVPRSSISLTYEDATAPVSEKVADIISANVTYADLINKMVKTENAKQ